MVDKKETGKRKYLIFALEMVAVAVLALVDQLIKKAVTADISGGDHIVLIKNFIGLTYTENSGAAFSFMSDSTELLSIFTLILLVVCVVVLFLGKIKGKLLNIGAVMIIAGGTGNLIDRFSKGYVVDYIETLFIDFPIFNFADILVTCGVAIVCIYLIYDIIKEDKKKKAEKIDDGADVNGEA